MSELTNFLLYDGTTHSGKTFHNIMGQSNEEFENAHDQIQWLFPLKESSQFQPDIPVLTDEDIDEISSHGGAVYGLLIKTLFVIEFYENHNDWLKDSDHNHLRITRIIKSFKLFDDPGFAEYFYNHIIKLNEKAGSPVNETSLKFWKEALEE